jgi:hypothetical protein
MNMSNNAIDLVYICGSGHNEELRYSIRSAVKNLKFNNLWVVGGKPNWYIGNYIEVAQNKSKYVNARNNLRAICSSPEISDSFILMNDDFYIMNKVDNVPYMHGGLLADKITKYKNLTGDTRYVLMLKRTLLNLSRRINKDVLDYELHVPMVMEKEKLLNVIELPDLWRSRYGNTFNVGGIEMDDVKVYSFGALTKKSYDINNLKYNYLSSNNDSFEMIKDKILNIDFADKTVYEA